eukprot:TRINITY_DN34352_c0_g1_i1.p1 TRINITY_DN34352_c0_g1~~TRINITY_DN34352_c0_g1_i1.p1  ORF type:complete len:593 (+),score=109.45 TRINITY_DN34352_c0_g1_i1:125-1903(+)
MPWSKDEARKLNVSGLSVNKQLNERINGIYVKMPVGATRGPTRAPVYVKQGRGDTYVYWDKMRSWSISSEADMRVRRAKGALLFTDPHSCVEGFLPDEGCMWQYQGHKQERVLQLKFEELPDDTAQVDIVDGSWDDSGGSSSDDEDGNDDHGNSVEAGGHVAVEPNPELPPSLEKYKVIGGIKYDRRICDLAEQFAADGEITLEEASDLWSKSAVGDGGLSSIASHTLQLVMQMYKCSGPAIQYLKDRLQHREPPLKRAKTGFVEGEGYVLPGGYKVKQLVKATKDLDYGERVVSKGTTGVIKPPKDMQDFQDKLMKLNQVRVTFDGWDSVCARVSLKEIEPLQGCANMSPPRVLRTEPIVECPLSKYLTAADGTVEAGETLIVLWSEADFWRVRKQTGAEGFLRRDYVKLAQAASQGKVPAPTHAEYMHLEENEHTLEGSGSTKEIAAKEVAQAVCNFVSSTVNAFDVPFSAQWLSKYLNLVETKTINWSWCQSGSSDTRQVMKYFEPRDASDEKPLFSMCRLTKHKEETSVEGIFWRSTTYKFKVTAHYVQIVPGNAAAQNELRKLTAQAGADLTRKISDMKMFVKQDGK